MVLKLIVKEKVYNNIKCEITTNSKEIKETYADKTKEELKNISKELYHFCVVAF